MTGFSTTVTISRPPDWLMRDVLKQTGGVQRLQRLVDLGGVDPAAGRRTEVGSDGVSLDPAIAFHDDRAGGLGSNRRRGRNRPEGCAEYDPGEDQGQPDPAPETAVPTPIMRNAPFTALIPDRAA